jgi:hypothetical protein
MQYGLDERMKVVKYRNTRTERVLEDESKSISLGRGSPVVSGAQKTLVDLSCCMKADTKDCCARERHFQELVVQTAGFTDLEHAMSA